MDKPTKRDLLDQGDVKKTRRKLGYMREATCAGEPPTIEGVVTRPSPFTMTETIVRLRATILRHDLTIFAEIDHTGAAQRVGLTMQPAHVLIFGSPKAGTPLMIASPLLALDLPLRLLVWHCVGDRIWVSSTSATYLQNRYTISQELVGNIAGADAVIAQALEDRRAHRASHAHRD